MVIALSVLLALGAAAASTSATARPRKPRAAQPVQGRVQEDGRWKKPVEDYLRKNKGKTAAPETTRT
jgi:hypothetical protein